jgi:hypothetical protein
MDDMNRIGERMARMVFTAFAVTITTIVVIASTTLLGVVATSKGSSEDGLLSNHPNMLDSLHSYSIVRPLSSILPITITTNTKAQRDNDVLRYSFMAYDRHYDLELTRSTDLFHPNYEEIIVGPNGTYHILICITARLLPTCCPLLPFDVMLN